jgi:hypothetical protein
MDEYLGDKFMNMVRLSSDVSEERDLDLWLYDEDRWPSGSAGGIVTLEKLEYRQKNILFTKKNNQSPQNKIHPTTDDHTQIMQICITCHNLSMSVLRMFIIIINISLFC